MPPNDEPVEAGSSSAPDLQILGDEITLQPSGYVEPEGGHEGKEQALMHQFASFRAEPLQYDPPGNTYPEPSAQELTCHATDSCEKYHYTFPVKAGELTTMLLANQFSTLVSRRT